MISLPELISQISGFSNRDPDVFKDSVIALTSSLWVMNVLISTNFIVGLSKRDQSLFNDAKETLITEMKRLDYNLNDYEVIPVLDKDNQTLLQLNLHQKSNSVIAAVNLNLKKMHKDKSMDLDRMYSYLLKDSAGVCLQLTGLENITAKSVRAILVQISNELRVISLMDLLDTYNKPIASEQFSTIQIKLNLINPWLPIESKCAGLYITSPIFNEYNCPFKLLATIQNIIFYIDQKCSSEGDMTLFDSINLPKFKNKLFGQSFHYIS
ncbi:hypothetical protein [Acinetobacter gandensis]|uniref:hypothetical protein n=1 Tax=Acinetobacter gandensis TaxID=1443941 RepID=UPI0039899879